MQFSEAYDVSRAISHGFEAFKRAWVPMFIGGALLTVLDGGCQGGSNSSGSGSDSQDWEDLQQLFDASISDAATLAPQVADGFSMPQMAASMPGFEEFGIALILVVVAIVLLLLVIAFVFRSLVFVGFVKVHHEILMTGSSSVGTLFSGLGRTIHLMTYSVLSSMIMAGVLAITAIPAGLLGALAYQQSSLTLGFGAGAAFLVIALPALVYVQLGMSLGSHVVVLEDEGAVGALERSWSLISGNRMWMLLYGSVMFLVMIGAAVGGLMALCLGVLVLVPIGRSIIDFGYTESFLLLTRPPEETREWHVGAASS